MSETDVWFETMICVELPHGIHLRPATAIVKLARTLDAEIVLCKENKQAHAKSLVSLLQLEAAQGCMILLRARGPDASSALLAISKQLQVPEASSLERLSSLP